MGRDVAGFLTPAPSCFVNRVVECLTWWQGRSPVQRPKCGKERDRLRQDPAMGTVGSIRFWEGPDGLSHIKEGSRGKFLRT